MELGYAFGKGIPILLATSDFIVQRCGTRTYSCDPLVDRYAAGAIVASAFKASSSPSEYVHEHWQALAQFGRDVAREVMTVLGSRPAHERLSHHEPSGTTSSFVDICGGRWFWSRLMEQRIREAAKVHLAFGQRWKDLCTDPGIDADVNMLAASSRALLIADGPEADAGTAFLHGAACAWGIPVAMFYSGATVAEGPGGQYMPRNLMLYESAAHHCTTFEEAVIFLNG